MRALVAIGCLGCLACSPPPLPPYAPDVDTGVVQPLLDAGTIITQPDAGSSSQRDGAQGQIDVGTGASDAAVAMQDAWSPPPSDDAALAVDDAAGGLISDADNF